MLKKEGKKTDWGAIGLNEVLEGNSLDAFYTLKVYTRLLKEVQDVGLEKLYDKLISPLTIVFRDIEYNGMDIDENKLKEIKEQLILEIEKIKIDMMKSKYIPQDYKLSGHNLLEILFSMKKDKEGTWNVGNDIGFGLYPPVMTAKGQPSTDKEDMKRLKDLVDKEYLRRGLNESKKETG